MKPHILHSTIALLVFAAAPAGLFAQAPAADETFDAPGRQYREQIERVAPTKRAEKDVRIHVAPPFPQSNSAASSVTTNSDGTATVTIEVNGKKETRTFQLGDGNHFVVKTPGAEASAATGNAALKETWIGIAMGSAVSPELRAQLSLQPGEGIVVAHVAPNSPAAKAGLQQHDILTRLDDQVLVTAEQFKTLVQMRKPGETAKITYYRKGERLEADVTFGEHVAPPPSQSEKVLNLIADPERWKGLAPEKWQDRLQILKEKSEGAREKLKDLKEKYPGVVIDKQSFFLSPDGTVKKIEDGLQSLEHVMKTLREELEKANIPQEKVDEVRKAVEAAIEKAGDTARKAAVDAIREYQMYREFREQRKAEKNALEAEKAEPPPQPTPPAPPIKTPQ